jgi:transcription initiation factor TFIIIB Brf1 subunit/transcription initiation factor TFIIB
MDCPACGAATVRGAVPDAHREYAPGESDAVAVCTRCLTVTACDEAEADPNWRAISDALPSDERAVGALLLVGLLDSLATNRGAIEQLLAALERDGVDAFATVDRLAADPDLDPSVDLGRRRHQLEQLL